MKIALCIHGQPRLIPQCASYILKNMCEGYDVDVFFHFWFDEKLQTQPYKFGGDGGWEKQRISPSAIEDSLKIYNPKLYKVEESKIFKDSIAKSNPFALLRLPITPKVIVGFLIKL